MKFSGRTWRAGGAASARLSGFDRNGGVSRDKCPITRKSPSAVHTQTFANTIFMTKPSIELPPAGSVPQINLIYRLSTRLCLSSSSQGSSGTHVILTDIVRSRKSVLFFIAADPTHASGGEQQPRPQLCGRLADSRPDPPADHSPG